MAIQILSTGLQTTVQDLGRLRKRHIGIPQSGAFEPNHKVSKRYADLRYRRKSE